MGGFGVFGEMGDGFLVEAHDDFEFLFAGRAGVDVLENESEDFFRGSARFAVFGDENAGGFGVDGVVQSG